MLVLLQTNRKGPVETSNSEAHITSPTTYLPTFNTLLQHLPRPRLSDHYSYYYFHQAPYHPLGHTDTTILVAEIVRCRPPPSL